MRILFLMVIVAAFAGSVVFAQESPGTGVLDFHANGEGFVREGFVSKDGWSLSLEHLYLSVSGIRAHQTNPPYDPFTGELTRSNTMVGLPGSLVIDLAEGAPDATPILLGSIPDAPAGYYNAFEWVMSPAEEGEIAGDTLLIDLIAEKDGQSLRLILHIAERFSYSCGAYVGDERKGVLAEGGTSDLEMTFHMDHIFGDANTPLEDSLNVTAIGFDPFVPLAVDSVIDVTTDDLQASFPVEEYQKFMDILPSLGHVGEGHCHEG